MSYLPIGLISFTAGIAMIAAGMGMQWPGAILIVAGLAAIVIAAWEPPSRNHPPDVDYRSLMAAAFEAQLQYPRLPDRYSRTAVSLTDDEPAHFCINFGGYDHAPIVIQESNQRPAINLEVELSSLPLRNQFDLAFRAVPGAQKIEIKTVWNGVSEDDYVCYEFHAAATRPTVIALRATTIEWNEDAKNLGAQFAVADEEIERARQEMIRLEREWRMQCQRQSDEWFAKSAEVSVADASGSEMQSEPEA